jgi:hypothetical protein
MPATAFPLKSISESRPGGFVKVALPRISAAGIAEPLPSSHFFVIAQAFTLYDGTSCFYQRLRRQYRCTMDRKSPEA